MKKLLTLAACAFVACGLVSPVSAASGINAAEKQLLDAVAKGVTVNGKTYAYGEGTTEYAQLQNIFDQDGMDLTSEDVKTISETMKSVEGYLQGKEVNAQTITEAIGLAAPITDILGVTISYDATKDTLTVKGADGSAIVSYEKVVENKGSVSNTTTSGVLENTGEDFMGTYAVFAGLAVVLAGAGALALRKKEVTE